MPRIKNLPPRGRFKGPDVVGAFDRDLDKIPVQMHLTHRSKPAMGLVYIGGPPSQGLVVFEDLTDSSYSQTSGLTRGAGVRRTLGFVAAAKLGLAF